MNRMKPPFRDSKPVPAVPNLCKTTGFSSPADDYYMHPLSLDDLANVGSPSVFFMRAADYGLNGHGVHTNDVLVVDKAKNPKSGSLIVAVIDADFRIMKYEIDKNGFGFFRSPVESEKPIYQEESDSYSEKQIWGVITHNLHEQIF
ncbi:LexA family protein [Pseudomonas syringae group genomosp. 3]|nr:S24 family peptidase [Pseudomonas syringae group genomosp. 3]